jgi:hypothetical protein
MVPRGRSGLGHLSAQSKIAFEQAAYSFPHLMGVPDVSPLMSTRPERLLRPLRPEPLRSRDDKASNCQAVISIVRIPVKLLGVCRVLTPEVTCVPPQLV